MVYHYTTLDKFISILTSYKNSTDKEYMTFWASNVKDQNDDEEMSFSFQDLMERIRLVEKESKIGHHKSPIFNLSNAPLFAFLTGKSDEELQKEINQVCFDKNHSPFTISFSHNYDKLLMWSIYANNGNGVCLAFDERKLLKLKTNEQHLNLNVLYNNKSPQINEYVRMILEQYTKEYDGSIIYFNQIARYSEIYLKIMLEFISTFIKNKAFRDEREWRIALFKNRNTEVYSRITASLNRVHYIKVGIPISALRNITIGPCARFDEVRNLLIEEAKDCGFNKIGNISFYKRSKVPYRII